MSGDAAVGIPPYEGSGAIGFGGSAFILAGSDHLGSGLISFSGGSELVSSSFSNFGSGLISISGTAKLSYLGDIRMADIGATTFMENVEVVFGETQGVELSIDDAEVESGCGCDPLPLALRIRHNVNEANKLESFLFRNAFILPRDDTLLYRKANNSWRRVRHYSGRGEITGTTERWILNFDFCCTSSIQNTDLGENLWKLGFFARRTIIETGEDFDTRMFLTVSPETICDLSLIHISEPTRPY